MRVVRCQIKNRKLEFIDPVPEEWEGREVIVSPMKDPDMAEPHIVFESGNGCAEVDESVEPYKKSD